MVTSVLVEKVKQHALELRKSKNPLGAVIQFHLSELAKIGKMENRETKDDEAIQYLKKAVQKLEQNPYANPDEITVLKEFLPQMASEKDLRDFIKTLDKTNKGASMKEIKSRYGALVDMKRAMQLLSE